MEAINMRYTQNAFTIRTPSVKSKRKLKSMREHIYYVHVIACIGGKRKPFKSKSFTIRTNVDACESAWQTAFDLAPSARLRHYSDSWPLRMSHCKWEDEERGEEEEAIRTRNDPVFTRKEDISHLGSTNIGMYKCCTLFTYNVHWITTKRRNRNIFTALSRKPSLICVMLLQFVVLVRLLNLVFMNFERQ
jgi:hypothetical protein